MFVTQLEFSELLSGSLFGEIFRVAVGIMPQYAVA